MKEQLIPLLKKLGIKLVLFDVDDTLVETYNHFVSARELIKSNLAFASNTSFEEISELYEQLNSEARQLYHVDPTKIWDYVFNGFKEKYPNVNPDLIDDYKKEYMQLLYEIKIPLKEGVLDLLQALKEAGIEIGLVTNADKEWTNRKLEWAGISQFFSPKRIVIIPPNQKKERIHWERAMEGVNPQSVLGLGDNFPVDILPCIELGAKSIFINDPNHLPEAFSQRYVDYQNYTIRLSSYTQLVKALERVLEPSEIGINDETLGVK